MKLFKYFVAALLGSLLTIAGEYSIPEQYTMNLTYGCWKSENNPNLVFLPEMDIYNGEEFFGHYGPESGKIQSYMVATQILLGYISRMDQESCNAVRLRQSDAK